MKIILGSKSAQRQEVLKDAGYDFSVLTADIDEQAIRHADPKELVLMLARAKAAAILLQITEPSLLITADQVAVCNGMILEKPRDHAEARKFIHYYRDYPLDTVSSVLVTNTATGQSAGGVDITRIYFKEIPESVIDEALRIGRIMHGAGAMLAQHPPFDSYVERLEGTFDSAAGMPLKLLRQLIDKVQ